MGNENGEAFTVLRLRFDARSPEALWDTPEAVGVIANAPKSPEALRAALAVVDARSTAQFHATEPLSAVGVGPVLDSSDKVQLAEFAHADEMLALRIDYTRIRMTGLTMPSSLPWRPILVAPIPAGLPPGRYEVEAVWRALSAIPGGRPLPVPDLREIFRFEIVA
jgi:hypothetical protein